MFRDNIILMNITVSMLIRQFVLLQVACVKLHHVRPKEIIINNELETTTVGRK